MGRLENRVVLVTGAASGIGSAYARRLAREGARLALVDTDGPKLSAVAAACRDSGAEALEVELDVSDPGAVHAAVDGIASRLGGIDGLVNNAAVFSTLRNRPFEEIEPAEFDRVLAVNARG
ncbi:MAG: SDR family NAD(P)-dependent oxidoreductase, partial [Candidatus Dormiibacterota bacterium]